MAASCSEFFLREFPSVDTEVSTYINSVLLEPFEDPDEIYEAIGCMLLEVTDKDESDIRDFCEAMFHLKFDTNGLHKKLESTVVIGDISTPDNDVEENQSNIWLAKRDGTLQKAEQKIKEKQEKRSKQDFKPAFASQQSSRRDNKMESSGSYKSNDIRIENFDVSFGEKVLLQSADLIMAAGRRYGLVGRNGIGKTTLLRMMGERHLKIPSHITILHVEQEVVGDNTQATQSVLECDTKREALLEEERQISLTLQSASPNDGSLSARLSEIYQQLEEIEADKAPARASMILNGLGFTTKMQTQPTKFFSGGWRMRLALARALFSLPDLLLLDEPTNMLDMKAILWLENYLQTWPSTILVVSHDRSFLNSVATDILHLNCKRLDLYKGDFEMFMKTRSERLKNQQKEYEAQKQYREHIQVFIDRFRYNANRASQVQSKLKLLEKLPELKPIEKESEVILRFSEADKLSPPILQLDELFFHYTPEHPIFKNVCLNANFDSRICIVGENGAGKSTLLKILLGELSPVSGVRHAHRNLRIGYFSQHHVDQLEMNQCPVEVLQARFPGKNVEFYRGILGQFGVSGELALRPVVSLSGGQKSRVAFAQMSLSNPNFFILDEPTNHLDMETIEALGKALNKFEGGVMLVSHDERLIRVICTELWVCSNYNVRSLEGGIDEYKKIVQQELEAQK
ncbi:hypothetical protein CAPTEDRAFT_166316 [Capitella teleta]|uniref:ATP-binding cassette sub-family F member 3 n=1 Tax=Capitella teleta TaxID=283909 RepID=R7T5M2_CAPTE|nr:hypothetical protein CAPTEDRAFT_166316 [Capitella teleta]|eukprot:ELT88565.1 hypothetical protein CAPTEDRAFT_166316 [Capitella teleta]